MSAALPILTLIVLLGAMKMRAQRAVAIALLVAIVVATAVYGMPLGQVVLSAAEGATFGLFPIMWIVTAAIWVYNLTVETGQFAVLRRSIGSVSEDQRIQAVLIAFCFGTLLEALAGFGAPAAITATMLAALGFKPIKAAALAVLGNTAAVPFGALAIPIVTLSQVTGLGEVELGAMVGRQTPVLALLLPFVLLGMVDGRRGIRQAWPVALVGGFAFAAAQFACSNYVSVALTDIVASIVEPRGDHGAPPCMDAGRATGRPAGPRRADGARLTPRHPPRVRAVPRHPRRVRDRAAAGGQARARRVTVDHELPVARPRRTNPRRGRAAKPHLPPRLAARCRDADADLRFDHHGGHRARSRPRAASGPRDGDPAQRRDRWS